MYHNILPKYFDIWNNTKKFIISLVTGKNKQEFITLMKKASYGDILTEDIKQQKQNAVHFF